MTRVCSKATAHHKSAFTLIEISIVLVIIGLIAGGILVGRELINAAQIRGTISQLEDVKTKVNTFRLKYNQIPGDMTVASAQQFGFIWSSYPTEVGNGDGVIRDRRGTAPYGVNMPEGEIILFWRHLVDAQLMSGSYSLHLPQSNTAAYPGQDYSTMYSGTCCPPNHFFPSTKVKSSSYLLPGAYAGINYLGAVVD